jgi:hypothetical protein
MSAIPGQDENGDVLAQDQDAKHDGHHRQQVGDRGRHRGTLAGDDLVVQHIGGVDPDQAEDGDADNDGDIKLRLPGRSLRRCRSVVECRAGSSALAEGPTDRGRARLPDSVEQLLVLLLGLTGLFCLLHMRLRSGGVLAGAAPGDEDIDVELPGPGPSCSSGPTMACARDGPASAEDDADEALGPMERTGRPGRVPTGADRARKRVAFRPESV